jgi:hypothetical protein
MGAGANQKSLKGRLPVPPCVSRSIYFVIASDSARWFERLLPRKAPARRSSKLYRATEG